MMKEVNGKVIWFVGILIAPIIFVFRFIFHLKNKRKGKENV